MKLKVCIVIGNLFLYTTLLAQFDIRGHFESISEKEHAILGSSESGYGLFASGSTGVFAVAQKEKGVGVYGHAGFGLYGIQGYSNRFAQTAVIGWSDSEAGNGISGVATNAGGKGVYGSAQDKAEWGGFFWGGKGAYIQPRLGINNHDPEHPIHAGLLGQGNGNGAHLTDGGSWSAGSSRTFKENFQEIDQAQILQKVMSLPISRWNYKESDEGEHIGPMAEDFHALFGLGNSDKYISTTDADGIALAAIQALYLRIRKLEQSNAHQADLIQKLLELN